MPPQYGSGFQPARGTVHHCPNGHYYLASIHRPGFGWWLDGISGWLI
jgi:hypothetical protein